MLNINNKLKAVLITAILSSNSLFSTNQEISENKRKKQKKKIIITRDMAINIGKFLPGDNQFLNKLVRAYPAEDVTYKNIAQKLIERKLIINSDKNISNILDKNFKTSRVNSLKSILKDNIDQIDNYPLLIDKQEEYFKSLLSNKKYLKFLIEKEEVLTIHKRIYKEIEYLVNSDSQTKEQLESYKTILDKIVASIQHLNWDLAGLTALIAVPYCAHLGGAISGVSAFLSYKVLDSAISISQFTISELFTSANSQDFLKIGLLYLITGTSAYISSIYAYRLANKLINDKKNKLISESQNIINELSTLIPRIVFKINQLA